MGYQKHEELYDGTEPYAEYIERVSRQQDRDKAEQNQDKVDSDDENYDSNLTENEKERFTKTFDDYDYDIPNHDSQTRRYDNDIYVRYKSGKFAGWIDLLEGVKLFKNVQPIHKTVRTWYIVTKALYGQHYIEWDGNHETRKTHEIRKYNDGTYELWGVGENHWIKIQDIPPSDYKQYYPNYRAATADKSTWFSEAESRRRAHERHKQYYKEFMDNAFYEYLSNQQAKIMEKLDALQNEPIFFNDLDPIHIEIEEIETIMEQVKQKLTSLRQVLFPSSTTGTPGLRVMLARLQQMS